MTQENNGIDVSIAMDDIRKVLNQDAKFALQVQNAALNRTVLELTTKLETVMGELGSAKVDLAQALLTKSFAKDNKGKKEV